MKEDETSTSIGGKLQQFSLGGSLISLQDKASGGSQAWSVEECFAFDHATARTPEAFLKGNTMVTVHVPLSREVFSRRMRGNPDGSMRETA